MALVKRNYVDGETIITAQNLNDIQDEVISLGTNKVPITRTINSKALSSNITLSASDVSAVPTTRKVSGKALSSDITITAADVGAVPRTRTVNSKALTSDITLAAGDIGYNSSTTYTSGTVGAAVSDLNGAVTSLQSNIDDKILYFSNQTVSAATSAQIMRIPSSGTNSKITTDTVVLECVFADHSAISGDVTWTSYSGYVAFTGTCKTATTANVVLGKKGN